MTEADTSRTAIEKLTVLDGADSPLTVKRFELESFNAFQENEPNYFCGAERDRTVGLLNAIS
jgi:hypothetical protein